jgi:hypothetical protein
MQQSHFSLKISEFKPISFYQINNYTIEVSKGKFLEI